MLATSVCQVAAVCHWSCNCSFVVCRGVPERTVCGQHFVLCHCFLLSLSLLIKFSELQSMIFHLFLLSVHCALIVIEYSAIKSKKYKLNIQSSLPIPPPSQYRRPFQIPNRVFQGYTPSQYRRFGIPTVFRQSQERRYWEGRL